MDASNQAEVANCFEHSPVQSGMAGRCQRMLFHSWDWLLVAICAGVMLLTNLSAPLLEPDESRYAEIPRLMLREGDWITPKLQGKPYNDKPPLVYWLVAWSYSIFGVSISAARLVPAISGWLTVLLVYGWTRRYFGRVSAGWICLMLLSLVGFSTLMRMLLLDGPFTLLVLAALFAGHHSLMRDRHPGWALLSALFCGLAVLAKGPVAVVLIAPCLFVLRWLDRAAAAPRWWDMTWYVLVVLAIALPWYVTMIFTNESFGSEHFWRHHVRRFLDPAHHERPFWYYVPVLFLELLPWPILLFSMLKRWRSWTGPERFLAVYCGWCLVFFSAAGAKLPTYLLPLLPAAAVLLGKQLQLSAMSISRGALLDKLVGACLVVMLVVLAGRGWILHLTMEEGLPRVDPWPLIGAALIACWLFRGTRSFSYTLSAPVARRMMPVAACLVLCWITHTVIPEYSRSASVVPQGLKAMEQARLEELPHVAFRNSWDALSFELGGAELEVFSSKEWEAFLAWMKSHPRCLVWMRDDKQRTTSFVQSLPPALEVERERDLGKIQWYIVRQKSMSLTQRESAGR